MLTTFAHAGHSHDMVSMGIDHCMPIIIGAGAIIIILLAVITYLVTNWQPKTQAVRKRK